MTLRRSLVALACAAVMTTAACTTTRSGSLEPGQSEVGRYVAAYSGPEVEVVVGHRWAARNLGSDWMILEVAISGVDRPGVTIDRDGIYVVTPRGDRIPLPDQRTFADAYASLQRDIRAATVASDPLDYFTGSQLECSEWFFTRPGAGLAFDEVSVHDRRVCQGYLFFPVPGGVEKGNWTLAMETPEAEARVSFRLEGEP